MDVKLSAVEAWKEANANCVQNSAAQKAAFEAVTAPLLARLQNDGSASYLHEVGKIMESTDRDFAARDMRLHHLLGIAAQQGASVYEAVDAQINSIASEDKLPNVDVTGLYNTVFRTPQRLQRDESHQQLCDEVNQKLKELSSPRRDLKR